MRLEGKTALITGAASGIQGELMGLGGTAAWLFVGEGAKVVVADINDSTGETTASQICESGGGCFFVHLDVTKEEDWKRAIQMVVSNFERLDILVNSAGIPPRYEVEGIEDTPLEEWDALMDTHAKGVFLGTKHAIPEMRRGGGGSIVNVSSIRGLVGSEKGGAYHAAKGAVRILTKVAAVQCARDGIRVNSVHPGFVLTKLTEKFLSHPDFLDAVLTRTPMGRLATAEEIAKSILYLASEESSFVTGAELVIDGGWTAQ